MDPWLYFARNSCEGGWNLDRLAREADEEDAVGRARQDLAALLVLVGEEEAEDAEEEEEEEEAKPCMAILAAEPVSTGSCLLTLALQTAARAPGCE
jgi:hypothetical protein